jgi:hypothetical protein
MSYMLAFRPQNLNKAVFCLAITIASVCIFGFNVCAAPISVPGTYKNIAIDGSFFDWTGVPLAYSQAQPSGDVVAFQNLYVANDNNYLYIQFNLYTNANPFTSKQNIFFDADTNAATGYSEHGLGSEMLIQSGNGYQETNGIFNNGAINGMGWLSSPAVPASEFEVRVSRNATYANGAPVFTNNTIAIFLESGESSGNEWFPNVTGGLLYTFATSSATTNALTVSFTSPTNGAVFDMPTNILLSVTTSDTGGGNVTNVAFYQGTTLLANVTTAPYTCIWTNVSTGSYALTAVAEDDGGAVSVSSVVNVTVVNLAVLQQIKTVFVIPLENHDWTQADPDGSPQQIFGNPAAPYINSLTTPGNSNAVQVSYATHYYSAAMGEHPSEPNYVWSEAGTEFGVHIDNDPSVASGNLFSNVMHLSGQLTAAAIPWRSYQEDVQYSSSATRSVSGSGVVNPYNGTTEYYYAAKHNPMEFFTDTQNQNVYPLTNFWADLTNNNIGRYNWVTPDVYNEMHSALPSGYNYHGVQYTGDQAAIAEGDNCLSIIIPKIMASQAYKDHGVIIIWTDETESTDDTGSTLPYIIISPLAKGNAYASTLPYSHSSDLKTMDEIFGLAYQTNAIPAGSIDAQNTGYNYVDGRSAVVNDLSDFFQSGPVIVCQPASVTNNAGTTASFLVGATAVSQLYYQWYFGTNMLAGQTNSTLNITPVGPANVGSYDVVVSSAGISTNSSSATLTVIYQSPNVVGGQMMLGTDGFHLTFSGPTNQTYEVLASDDMALPRSAWTVVGTGTFNNSNVFFIDSDATNHPHRFYVIESP